MTRKNALNYFKMFDDARMMVKCLKETDPLFPDKKMIRTDREIMSGEKKYHIGPLGGVGGENA
jgi:hypothetical protein